MALAEIQPIIKKGSSGGGLFGSVLGTIVGAIAGAALSLGTGGAAAPAVAGGAAAAGAGAASGAGAGIGAGALSALGAASTGAGLGNMTGGIIGGKVDPATADEVSSSAPQTQGGGSLKAMGQQPEIQLATLQNAQNNLKEISVPNADEIRAHLDMGKQKLMNHLGIGAN